MVIIIKINNVYNVIKLVKHVLKHKIIVYHVIMMNIELLKIINVYV